MAGCVRQSISGIDQWERIMKKKKKFCFTKKIDGERNPIGNAARRSMAFVDQQIEEFGGHVR